MTFLSFIMELDARIITVSVVGKQLKLSAPKGVIDDRIKLAATRHKCELVKYLTYLAKTDLTPATTEELEAVRATGRNVSEQNGLTGAQARELAALPAPAPATLFELLTDDFRAQSRWDNKPVTPRQRAYLARCNLEVPDDAKCGECSYLIGKIKSQGKGK